MDDAAPDAEVIEVDVVEAVELPSLSTRIEWVEEWEEQTAPNRKLCRQDRDYFDGHQWTRDELDTLRDRGQPPLVKNYIAPKVNFICGEEIRKRVDPVARPRTPQHEDAARSATDALRFVKAEQKLDQVRSAVLRNMLVEGFAGAIKEVEECGCEDGSSDYKFKLTHIHPDRLGWDPHSRALDFSDARYKFIIRWADLEDAIEDYPEAEADLRAALTRDVGESGGDTDDVPRGWTDRKRKRIQIVEMYFRVGDDWYRSDFTKGADLVEPTRTAYLDEEQKHSVCPLVMASCYIDQNGNRYGIVRQLISPQDEINKRASKALHLLSVRQVIAEKDAIPDPHKFQSELAKPDGFAEVAHGRLADNSVQIQQTGDLTQGHVAMMEQAKQDIDRIGPSAAQLPDLPDSASGRAVIARQQAASQEMGGVFDSLRDWTLAVFELDWLCIRQYWTEEKWFRVTDDAEDDGYRFVALNQPTTRAARFQELLQRSPKPPMPKALQIAAGVYAPTVVAMVQEQLQAMMQQAQAMGAPPPQGQQLEQVVTQMVAANPLMQEQVTANQVEKMLVDIVLDVTPETAILAQEQFQTLMELLPVVAQTDPSKAPVLLRLAVKASSLPDKRELLTELTKQPDPQEAQMKQQAQQLQMAQAKAGVAATQTQAQLNAAKAQHETVKAQTELPRAQADIQESQGQAMIHAANAGEKMGGAAPGMQPGGL